MDGLKAVPFNTLHIPTSPNTSVGTKNATCPARRLNKLAEASVVPVGTCPAFSANPGLTSWAKFSRPSGTDCGNPRDGKGESMCSTEIKVVGVYPETGFLCLRLNGFEPQHQHVVDSR